MIRRHLILRALIPAMAHRSARRVGGVGNGRPGHGLASCEACHEDAAPRAVVGPRRRRRTQRPSAASAPPSPSEPAHSSTAEGQHGAPAAARRSAPDGRQSKNRTRRAGRSRVHACSPARNLLTGRLTKTPLARRER
jgi:hypothetical protein